MVSPLAMLGIGLAAILATGTFVSLSGSQVEYAVTAANSAETQNSKVKETIEVEAKGNKIDISSNWAKHSRIKEIMVLDKDGKALFQKSSDMQLPAFTSSSIDMKALGFSNIQDKKVLVVTDLGNVFAPEIKKEKENDDNENPLSGAGGFGSNAYVRTIEREGTVRFGSGITGDDASLKPHVSVPSGTSFAALIQKDDRAQTFSVPEFGKEYKYVSGSLQPINIHVPNALSFSNYKSLQGSGSASNGDKVSFSASGGTQYGYHCNSHYDPVYGGYHSYCHYGYYGSNTGTNLIAAKLNSVSGQYLLKGDVNSGTLKIVKSPFDLTATTYESGKGYKIHDGSARVNTYSYQQRNPQYDASWCYWRGGSYCHYYVTVTKTSVDLDITKYVTSNSDISAVYEYSESVRNCNRYNCSSSTVSRTLELSPYGYDSGGWFYLRSVSGSIDGSISPNGTVKVYDKSGGKELVKFTTKFEQLYTFPSDQLYIVAELSNGGSASVKAEKMDPNAGVYFKVTGLPANIAYQIEKSGLIGVRGMADQNGAITLTASSVDVKDSSSPGGILKIFPNSKTYRGSFSTVVFDTINNQAFNIAGPNKVYVPFAYVRIPFPTDTKLQSVSIDGKELNYIAREYKAGSGMDVPVLPGMKKIILGTAGGTTTITINMADVDSRLSFKPITPVTSSSSAYKYGGSAGSVSVDAGRHTTIVANARGTVTAMVQATVSGDASITITDPYSRVIEFFVCRGACPSYVQPIERTNAEIKPVNGNLSPLEVFVDVYKNGQLLKSEKIFTVKNALVEAQRLSTGTLFYTKYTNPFTGQNPSHIAGQTVDAYSFEFPQQSVSSFVSVDAEAGDLLEFYARAHITATGVPLSSGATISAAKATAQIHNGSILLMQTS